MNFRREIFIGAMLTFLISSMFIWAFHVFPVKSTEWTVDDDGPADFHSIQDAVNNASSGDSIYVYNGTYYEAVVIDETLDALTLTGENRSNTIINGSGFQYIGPLVTILANNVTVSGFTVTDARREGIAVLESQFCNIHDNIVCFTGDRGIVFTGGLGSLGNHIVHNNIVFNSSFYGGIETIRSNHNLIFDNIAYFNQWGISTNHGSYNEIFDNIVFSNRETGIHIDWPSTGNIIHNNNITLNLQVGIRVLNQANLTVISHNTISRSDIGMHLVNSFANTISENYITDNLEFGIVLSPSENNSIHHNSFRENNQQALADPSYYNIWDEGYPSGGNYWSDYTGTDLYSGPYQNETGRDGIGDTPYIINMNNTDRYPLMGIRNYEDRVTQVVSTESIGDSNISSMAVDPNGVIHVAWHDQPDLASGLYDIFYRRFEPGLGWSFTEIVSTESTANSLNPSLAIDPNGNTHIAWQDQTNLECGTDWDIFYKRYEVGTGWTSTEVVSTESTANSLNPSLAIDPNGNTHIAWQDQTNLECGTDWDIFYKGYQLGGVLGQDVQELPWNVDPDYMESASYSNVFYEKGLQGSWTSTEVVSTESTANSLRPSLAVDPNGNIHIAWDDTTDYVGSGSDPDIFYKRYEIGPPGGWNTTEVVSTESTLASYDSSLDVDLRGRVHIAWEDQTDLGCGSDWDIFYKKLLAGVNWTSTEVVSTESTEVSLYPSLGADLAGNVYVAWCDNTSYTGCGSDFDIFFKIWEVRTGWTTTEVVSTESPGDSWYPSLAVDMMKNVHIAWTDYSDYAGCGDDPDIFYKYIRLHSTRYPWSMFRHNPRRTGYIESPAPNINRTQWTYTTGGNVRSSPAVIDGIVYIGSNDGNIYALDQHTGAQIWNQTIGLSVISSPAVAYSRVYVGSSDNKVYCLDALTGTHVWNQTTGASIVSSPAVVEGKVYVGSGYGEGRGIVYCLDA
ncbi:MAG: pectinesterase family protein, partial [Candidatus Bathyarchaeota archaeon]